MSENGVILGAREHLVLNNNSHLMTQKVLRADEYQLTRNDHHDYYMKMEKKGL